MPTIAPESGLWWLTLAWVAYAVLHSALASFAVKDRLAGRWPAGMSWYRLAYNGVAMVTALPLAWLIYTTPGDWLWRWNGAWAWLSNGLTLAALAGIAASARYYDMDEFTGLRQIREGAAQVDRRGGFTVSPFHRFVRHPWYFFALVILWTRDMNAPLLLSAVAITLYFAVGSWFEERKLVALHGDAYRRYRNKVPGLLPLPWKYLKAEETKDAP